MLKMKPSEFKSLAVLLINEIYPKEFDKGIFGSVEFEITIGDKPYLVRSFTPSNYRQIWVKYPTDMFQQEKENDDEFCQKHKMESNVFGEWIKVADHDSCWREGLSFSKQCNETTDDSLVLHKISWGELPTFYYDGQDGSPELKYVKKENGDFLAPLMNSLIVEDKTLLYMNLFQLFFELKRKPVCFDFFVQTPKTRKRKFVLYENDSFKTGKHYQEALKSEPLPFTVSSLEKILKGDISLYSII